MSRTTKSPAPLLKIATAVLLMLILIGGMMLLLREREQPAAESADASSAANTQTEPPARNDPASSVSADTPDSADRIESMVTLAKEGRIEAADFVVGSTGIDDVKSKWQAPEQTSSSGGSVYAEYPAHFATVGYKNDIVTDLRSDDESLGEIRYRDILDTLGQADSVKTYKDDNVDQIILGYNLSGGYVLRWILPKPWAGEGNEANENPPLDHISLIRTAQNEAGAAASPGESAGGGSGEAAAQTTTEESAADVPDNQIAVDSEAAEKPDAPSSGVPASSTADHNDSASIPAGMTLDEKIGQMIIAGVEGTSLLAADQALIRDHGVGGVIFYADNIESAAQTKKFVDEAKAANRNDELPLIVSVDQEGGRVARLKGVDKIPTAGAIGERNDAAYARSIGEKLGEQLLSQGFNLDYAPVLDVNSNPNNPVIGDRSFGASAAVVSKLGIPVMQGLESNNVIPVVKHFPGHGDTSVDSHISLPVVNKSLAELDKLELVPFKKAIAEKAEVVMIAHILLPKLDKQFPSSMSKAIITDLLRGKLGFEGIVITDDMTMGAIAKNYGIGEAAVQSVKAGSDIVLVAHGADNAIDSIEAIKQAVKTGRISEQRIDESIARIFTLKKKYLK